MIKEKTKKEKVEEKTEEKPTPEPEIKQTKPIDFEKIFNASQKCMPDIIDMLKPKKKDPSTMCEFTIKGNEEFVLNCLSMILG